LAADAAPGVPGRSVRRGGSPPRVKPVLRVLFRPAPCSAPVTMFPGDRPYLWSWARRTRRRLLPVFPEKPSVLHALAGAGLTSVGVNLAEFAFPFIVSSRKSWFRRPVLARLGAELAGRRPILPVVPPEPGRPSFMVVAQLHRLAGFRSSILEMSLFAGSRAGVSRRPYTTHLLSGEKLTPLSNLSPPLVPVPFFQGLIDPQRRPCC